MKRSRMNEGIAALTHRQQLLAAMNILLAAPFFDVPRGPGWTPLAGQGLGGDVVADGMERIDVFE